MNQNQAPATKADILALQSDILALDSKLTGKIDRVATEYARLRGEMHDREDRLTQRMDANTSRLLKVLEDYAGKTNDLDRRTLVFGEMLGKKSFSTR